MLKNRKESREQEDEFSWKKVEKLWGKEDPQRKGGSGGKCCGVSDGTYEPKEG